MIWIISIAWLCLNLIIAVPILENIYKHYKEKAIVQVTIIDLIHCDLIVWIYLCCLDFSVAIAHCLFHHDEGLAVNDFFANLYSRIFEVILLFISSFMILVGGLRLLSLAKRSEAAGLQLLGPDDTAIMIARFIYLVPSIILELVVIWDDKVRSGLFDLFHSENSSYTESR
jgi:hypothetical protein